MDSKKRARDEITTEDAAQAAEETAPPQAKRPKANEGDRDDAKDYLHFTIVSSPGMEGGICPNTYLVRHKEGEKADAFVLWLQQLEDDDKDAHDTIACVLFELAKTKGHFTLEEAIAQADEQCGFDPKEKKKNAEILGKLLDFDVGQWEKLDAKHNNVLHLDPPKSLRFAYVYSWC